MLDTGEKGAEGSAFARTTFADGRMTTKEAWNQCRQMCADRGIEAPTLRTFKWHLKHGNAIKAEMVPNPFGGAGPDKVHSIAPDAVVHFVGELERLGDELRVVEQATPRKDVIRRSLQKKKDTPPRPSNSGGSGDREDTVELDGREALSYLRTKVGRGCELNQTTFGFYLAYDVISSRFEGRQRMVRRADLDAFLELVPDGVYANHLSYETETKRDDLSMRDAYAYYSDVDPSPITLNSFRSLVAAGVIRPIRTADSPRAPVVGFGRQEIVAFLALRQRILDKNAGTPTTKSFLTRKKAEKAQRDGSSTTVTRLMGEALERARPVVEKAKRDLEGKPKTKAKNEAKPKRAKAPDIPARRDLTVAPLEERAVPESPAEPKRVSVKEAYAYYRKHAGNPYTFSWFKSKIYSGSLFDANRVSPRGSPKKYLVSLKSIDDYLATSPTSKPKPEFLPIETAYHKFSDLIPAGLSLLQFKRVVKEGHIKSVKHSGVAKVGIAAVRECFQGSSGAPDRVLPMTAAYDYYCSRTTDPVARAHFSRWVVSGQLGAAERNEEGRWQVAAAEVDAFVEEHPTGRLRSNRKSRVATKESTDHAHEAISHAHAAQEPEDETRVTVSIRDYSSPAELKEAIEILARQGLKVDVRP